jgi:hypothetical protein
MPAMNKQHRAAGRPRNTPYRRFGTQWPANWLTVLYDQIHPFCVLSARRRGRQPQLWALDQMFCPARNDDRASSILLKDAALIRVLI